MRTLRNMIMLASLLGCCMASASQIINVIKNKEFVIIDAAAKISCFVACGESMIEIKNPPELLKNSSVSVEVFDRGVTCKQINMIKQSLKNTFGAVYGSFDSTLLLENDVLFEDLKITLRDSSGRPDPTSVTLVTRVSAEHN